MREGKLHPSGATSEEVDRLRNVIDHGAEMLAHLETRTKEQTGIKNMKVSYNKVFGYYIEVAKSQTELVPPDWARKQTTVNAERYITQELKDLEHTILSAQDKVTALEYQLFCQLKEQAVPPRWPRSRRPPPPWPRWMCSPPSPRWPPSTATACPRWTAPTP